MKHETAAETRTVNKVQRKHKEQTEFPFYINALLAFSNKGFSDKYNKYASIQMEREMH